MALQRHGSVAKEDVRACICVYFVFELERGVRGYLLILTCLCSVGYKFKILCALP